VSKPTLGYASRTEAILALKAQGVRTKDIGPMLGIKRGTVSTLYSLSRNDYAHREGKAPTGRVYVERWILDALRPNAKARGIHSNWLAARLLKVIVESGLIDAVLDDGPRAETGRE
jgi:hypothetical protein